METIIDALDKISKRILSRNVEYLIINSFRSDILKRCGLLGRNIQYSLSPEIHNEYYAENEIDLHYELFDIEEKHLEQFINNLSEKDIIGFNVTIPYKEIIIKYLDILEYPADRINAVNTVLIKNNSLVGYNTDYFGFIKSLEDYNLNLENKRALILGNGGAAKSVCCALKDLKCKGIDIAARDIKRSGDYFKQFGNVTAISNIKDLGSYNIIINCTPLGGINYLNESPIQINHLEKECIVYDLVYNPRVTTFLKSAQKFGAVTINGEKMLKYQAYKAVDIWLEYDNV
ncbi:putative shikimate dehydrogenase [Clostridiales bacterium oral taxon 876 str. F0540]|nr:putative shikimate dehydrogenase [Clostridiales bacterium oral taxon 876 str. F0540]